MHEKAGCLLVERRDEIRVNYVTLSAAFPWKRGKIVRVYVKLMWAQNTPLRYTAGHRHRLRQH